MTTRFLINDDGSAFERPELEALRGQLDALDDNARVDFRDQNASAIARHDANKFLIVSGPGTGKSHLFLDRIKYWCEKNADARVLVTSFVRKLVADLQNDIDQKLSDEQKCKITALLGFKKYLSNLNFASTPQESCKSSVKKGRKWGRV